MALRWEDCLPGRIIIDERVYDGEFEDVKAEAGDREVPLVRHGVILGALKVMWECNKNFRKPGDLVFANNKGKPLDRHNLLHCHLKQCGSEEPLSVLSTKAEVSTNLGHCKVTGDVGSSAPPAFVTDL